MKLRTVVLSPAAMRVLGGLERSAARDPPVLVSESAHDQLALGT